MSNPLQQYFRRPAFYYKLPSGTNYYDPSVVEVSPTGEVAIYPMTNADEIVLRTPDALFNGTAIVQVIENCVPAVKDAWKLSELDSDALIVAIRAASVDGKLDIESTCPKCEESTKFDVDLMKLLMEKQRKLDYSEVLTIGDLEFKFRPLTYAEVNANAMRQFEVQRMIAQLEQMEDSEQKQQLSKDSMNKLTTMLIEVVAQTIEYIKTPEVTVRENAYIVEFMEKCDTKTNTSIKEFSGKMRNANSDTPLDIKCSHCSNEYSQPLELNYTNFFG